MLLDAVITYVRTGDGKPLDAAANTVNKNAGRGLAALFSGAIDAAAGLAVITGDVARGTGPEAALEGIRLLMLANDTGPATAFSPVAATPDELLHAWNGGRVHLNLDNLRNGKSGGPCSAGDAMRWHFGELIAHLCQARPVRAGSIVGSGALAGEALQVGDTLRIEMKGPDGMSVFGAIEQRVVAPA